jgi:hypothetical protein
MKKNVKKSQKLKASKKSVVFAFVIGVVVGAFGYANHDMVRFGPALKCLDGTLPDRNGCCTGEVYTNMGDLGYNCCPSEGGDCFPPIK